MTYMRARNNLEMKTTELLQKCLDWFSGLTAHAPSVAQMREANELAHLLMKQIKREPPFSVEEIRYPVKWEGNEIGFIRRPEPRITITTTGTGPIHTSPDAEFPANVPCCDRWATRTGFGVRPEYLYGMAGTTLSRELFGIRPAFTTDYRHMVSCDKCGTRGAVTNFFHDRHVMVQGGRILCPTHSSNETWSIYDATVVACAGSRSKP